MDAVECKHTEHWTQQIQQIRLGEWMFSMRTNVADKNKTLITANENFVSCVCTTIYCCYCKHKIDATVSFPLFYLL